MRVFNNGQQPNPTFWDTGFYHGENWRYTGKYGLVKHDVPIGELPQYGDDGDIDDSILGSIALLPVYLLGQMGVSLADFGKNVTNLYTHDKHSIVDDLMTFPYALADFIPAIVVGAAAVFAPLWAPFAMYVWLNHNDVGCLAGLLVSIAVLLSPILIPLAVAAGALIAVHGMVTTGLMLTKAALETSLSLLTVISIPLKGVASIASSFISESNDLEEGQKLSPCCSN